LEVLEIVKKDSIKPTCNGGAFGLIGKMETLGHLQEFPILTCHPNFFGKNKKLDVQQLGKELGKFTKLVKIPLPTRIYPRADTTPHREIRPRRDFSRAREDVGLSPALTRIFHRLSSPSDRSRHSPRQVRQVRFVLPPRL